MHSKFYTTEFPYFSDERGGLIPFEFDEKFPFKAARAYLVTAHKNQVRGGHAHKVESEMFVAAHGTITALVNDGSGDEIITLNAQNKALVVKPFCWHEFYDFSDDAVLLCFSSTHYLPGEENYIMDKEAFLQS